MGLKIEHLTKYPDLTCLVLDDDGNYFRNKIKTIYPKIDTVEILEGWDIKLSDNVLFPLLYPIEDVMKTIIVNGEEIIPLVELTKIEDRQFNRVLKVFKGTDRTRELNEKYVIHYLDNDGREYYFCFKPETKSFSFYDKNRHLIETLYELRCYDYLHKMHIDLYDLIPNGIAYDFKNK